MSKGNRPRIVSLLPSATEIVCALGFGDALVGRSHECDFPTDLVADLPACTVSKIDVEQSSKRIDQAIKQVWQEHQTAGKALSVYEVDAAMLDELTPDLILTQDQCEVCAVNLSDVQRAVDAMVVSKPRVRSFSPLCLEDLWKDIEGVAEAVGDVTRGCELLERLRRRVAQIGWQSAQLEKRSGVTCLEWLDPVMGTGNWVPQLVELAGAVDLFGRAGEHSEYLSWEDFEKADPRLIVSMPCGLGIERSRRDLEILLEHPVFGRCRAVRGSQVFLTDGNQYFNRPGPRLVESLEILAEIFHPEVFDFGHADEHPRM